MPSITLRALVVIPTLNEAHHIGGVIESLLRGLPADAQIRLVVADGGSTDGTQDLVRAIAARRLDVVLLENPARLQSAAVNLAVRKFGDAYPVLVRCDAHAEYPPDFIVRLIASLHEHKADAVVVPMDSVGATPLQRGIAWLSNSPMGTGGASHRGGHRSGFVDHGHHAAFRMSSFVRAGGYDESFSHNEDAELDCRQRAMGSSIFLDASIRVRYVPRGSLVDLAAQYRAYGRGRSRTMRRHPASWRARQVFLPLHVLACVLALALQPIWPALVAYPLSYLGGLVLGAGSLWRQHADPAAWLAAPAALVMHVAWSYGFLEGLISIRESRWQPDVAPEDSRSMA